MADGAGLSPWRPEAAGRRGASKDWSTQPGSIQAHPTESEGLPGGVRRGAPRRAAILQRRALSDVDRVRTSENGSLERRSSARPSVRCVGGATERRACALVGGAPKKRSQSQAAGMLICSRDSAPCGKRRTAQPHRCVEVSKTRKSGSLGTAVCGFLALLPQTEREARAGATPSLPPKARRNAPETSPVRLQTGSLTNRPKNGAHRAPATQKHTTSPSTATNALCNVYHTRKN